MNSYWHKYFPFLNKKEIENSFVEIDVEFGGYPAVADLYYVSDEAPTIIFIHGIGLYARFCAPICHFMFKRGYNVLALNLPGHFKSDQKGHFPMTACIAAIKDSVEYCHERFNENVYLAGGSFGGALCYYAAAAGANVKALVSYSIFDMSNKPFKKSCNKENRFLGPIRPLLPLISKLFPKKKITMRKVFGKGIFRRGYPENWEGFNLFRHDKNLTSSLTVKTYAQLAKHAPEKKYHEFDSVPIRIIYPTRERLFDSSLMHKAFDQIKAIKDLVILDQDHWPVYEKQITQTADSICDWFDKWSINLHIKDAPKDETTKKEEAQPLIDVVQEEIKPESCKVTDEK